VTDASPALDRVALLASFARHGVRFVLVGGLAAQAHGAARRPRTRTSAPSGPRRTSRAWPLRSQSCGRDWRSAKARSRRSRSRLTLARSAASRSAPGAPRATSTCCSGPLGGAGLSWSATSSLPRTRRSSKSMVCASWSRRSRHHPLEGDRRSSQGPRGTRGTALASRRQRPGLASLRERPRRCSEPAGVPRNTFRPMGDPG
jgi:hypothetical protein